MAKRAAIFSCFVAATPVLDVESSAFMRPGTLHMWIMMLQLATISCGYKFLPFVVGPQVEDVGSNAGERPFEPQIRTPKNGIDP